MGSAVSIFSSKQKWPVTLIGHEGSVSAMCISTDGSLVGTASEDSTARVWESATYSLESQMTGHTQYTSCIDMDENFIVTGSADKLINKWDVFSGCCLGTFIGHESVITEVLIHGNHLFSAALDKTVHHWDLKTDQCLHVYCGHTRSISYVFAVHQPYDSRPTTGKTKVSVKN